VPGRNADHDLLGALDRLYTAFNHPESAYDPIQIVRRYSRLEDRELIAFIAAGLAFGRVSSVMASVEAVCGVLGAHPARFIRAFDPDRDGAPLRPLVHRWTRGDDLVALVWVLRALLETHGSLEAAFAEGVDHGQEIFKPSTSPDFALRVPPPKSTRAGNGVSRTSVAEPSTSARLVPRTRRDGDEGCSGGPKARSRHTRCYTP
jgi:hypothetical protein